MSQKRFLTVAGTIFALVSLAHLVRAAMGWPITIAGWNVPIWLSWVAFAGAGLLSYFALSLVRRTHAP
jgi:hypothetical protein